MKLDPHSCKINYEENLFWAIIHDCIAHFLCGITLYKVSIFLEFHSWTSHKAWKRKKLNI